MNREKKFACATSRTSLRHVNFRMHYFFVNSNPGLIFFAFQCILMLEVPKTKSMMYLCFLPNLLLLSVAMVLPENFESYVVDINNICQHQCIYQYFISGPKIQKFCKYCSILDGKLIYALVSVQVKDFHLPQIQDLHLVVTVRMQTKITKYL